MCQVGFVVGGGGVLVLHVLVLRGRVAATTGKTASAARHLIYHSLEALLVFLLIVVK